MQQKVAFTYPNNNTTPTYILATFSTNENAGDGSAGDYLQFDDAVLIYNTKLEELWVNDEMLPGYNPYKTTYTYNLCAGEPFPEITDYSPISSHATATVTHNPTTAEPYHLIKVTHKNQENIDAVSTVYRINYTIAGSTVAINGDNSVCAGGSVTLTASGADSYSWSNGQQGASITVSPTATQTYTVTGTTGGCSATASHTVTVKTIPTVEISGDESVCAGSSVTLTASGASSYSWQHGGNNAETTVQPTSETTYTVTGTTNGCSATATHTVTVKTAPTVAISGDESVCAGTTVTLTASGADSYSWNTGAENASIEVTPTTTTVYTVTGTANGCSATATHTVNVKEMPNVQISGNDKTFCLNEEVTLTATGADNYEWSTGSHDAAITFNATTLSATYTVTGTTNGCSATASTTVKAFRKTFLHIDGPELICDGESATLTVSGGHNYEWDNGSTEASIEVTPAYYTTTSQYANYLYRVDGLDDNGCPAYATHSIGVKPAPTVAIQCDNSAVCPGESLTLTATGAESYDWAHGDKGDVVEVTPTETTTYTVTGTTNGCSATATLTVTVKDVPTVTISGDESVCAGSSVTLTATGASSYSWQHGGNNAETTVQPTTETTYTVTGTTDGCSATATHTVAVRTAPTIQISGDASVCAGGTVTLTASGADSYEWQHGGNNAETTVQPTTETTYTVTGTTNGCSATATHTISVKTIPNVHIFGDKNICTGTSTLLKASGADSFVWNTGDEGYSIEVSPESQTTYSVTGTTDGCSATASHTINVKDHPNVQISGNTSVCKGESITLTATGADSYEWEHGGNDAEISVTPEVETTYIVTGSLNGCSATATHTVAVRTAPTIQISGDASVCAGGTVTLTATGADSYAWEHGDKGAVVQVTPTEETTYTVTGFSNQCAATATHTVTVKALPNVTISGAESVCEGKSTTLTASGADSYEWDNDKQDASIEVSPEEPTTYTVTGTTNGCSATATHNVSVTALPTVTISGEESVCAGESIGLIAEGATSYEWNTGEQDAMISVTPETETTYTVIGTTDGCSGTATHTVVVNPNKTYTFEATACDEYYWENDRYDESGEYIKSYFTDKGCDSTVTLILTINKSQQVTFDETACGQFVWDGDTYTESQTITKSYTNANGCDSIVTINLTISDIIYKEFTEDACDSYTWDNEVLTQSGDYTKEYKSTQGCDSIVTLHLTINKSDNVDDYVTACNSYVWGNDEYLASGDYEKVFTNSHNCDSIVTLHLTINQTVETEFEDEACEIYRWNNESYRKSGDYTQTFTAANGCDSIVTLHLTINFPDETEEYVSSCESYVWGDEEYLASGDYEKVFTNAHGCDSIVTLHLTINQNATFSFDSTACGPVEWEGETYEKSGEYSVTRQTTSGCDSVVTMNLTIYHPVYKDIDAEACGSYLWDNDRYEQSGEYQKTFQATNGCDSIVTLNLTIYPTTKDTIAVTACDKYVWGESEYSESGLFTQTFTSSHNCDSTVTIDLTINHPVTSSFDTISCHTVTWNGKLYAESGSYEQTLTGSNGCDSIVTMNLEIVDCGFECEITPLVDIDNNEYKTVSVGKMCWMAENLRAEHYADGSDIPVFMTYVSKLNANEEENFKLYGYLYDWASATHTEVPREIGLRATSATPAVLGACPAGWRLPTVDEYLALIGIDYEANDLRSTDCWIDNAGTDKLGTAIRPGGIFNATTNQFEDLGGRANLIVADKSFPDGSPLMTYITLSCGCPALLVNTGDKANAYSVRCVKEIIALPH
ncbi:MAG: fibrobacter succinogenes major paralogous domain-containing protein [Bacteroidales bacterium]|nr:fibrobacter succinogenes major paralogous domain-containing protein [Bacteroidales bacterium]